MEALRCPSCGSPALERGASGEYKCPYCGTRFVLTSAPGSAVETGLMDVVLVDYPRNKQIHMIKALREATSLSLAAAKRATENLPAVIAENLSYAESERVRMRLEEAGATVEVRPA
jgi:ribosomal protein L7/L12